MTCHIRRAGPLDARPMANLMNEIIARGGTTAMTAPVSRADLTAWMDSTPKRAAWHVAEDDLGALLGFQWIEPHPNLPPEACDIATFVRIDRTGLGTGSALFDITHSTAKALDYAWINATIRADNAGGLAYYQSRGFETYATETGVTLAGGLTVDRVCKRFDL